MSETTFCTALIDESGKLVSYTGRFAREFPKGELRRLLWEAWGLLGGQRERKSLRLGRFRIILQLLSGERACVVVSVYALPEALERLSPRQQEIAQLAAEGATATEIAQVLTIGFHTVRQHMKEIYRRLEVGNRAELANCLAAS